MTRIIVIGIGTGIGKTIASSVLVEALKADYWKPVQCGDLDNSDTKVVDSLVSCDKVIFHQEAYRLKGYKSPHAAATEENVVIDLTHLSVPETENTLIIEPPGGLMVPLNDTDLVIDLIKLFEADVVLVSQNYLGSINHTLLTAKAMHGLGINVLGIIFNGEPNKDSEEIILKITELPMLGRIELEDNVNKEMILKYAPEFVNV